jgi:hypothetical protein
MNTKSTNVFTRIFRSTGLPPATVTKGAQIFDPQHARTRGQLWKFQGASGLSTCCGSPSRAPKGRRVINLRAGLALLVFASLSFVRVTECAAAQPASQQLPLDPLLQLMITQPSIEVTTNLQVSASFDPPTVRPGEKSLYRVTVNALTDSVEWPTQLAFPPSLEARLSARGQILIPSEGKLKPQTAINYHVIASREGFFATPEFRIQVYGRSILVPAARLSVTASAPSQTPQMLSLEMSDTNYYVGQPIKVVARLKGLPGNIVHGIQELRINGEGFLVDLAGARQSINVIPSAEGNVIAYQHETTLSPLKAGQLVLSAQGFTGNRFSGPIIIQGQVTIPGTAPQFQLVDSDPVTIHVQPLPRADELPGFTGAIGMYRVSPPQLSTNRIRTGDLLKLSVMIEGEGNLHRLVPPPPPTSTNWQVHPAVAGDVSALQSGAPLMPGSFAVFTYTLIPLTTNALETPAIPFSYFNPDQRAYVDASIPPAPVTVLEGNAALDARMLAAMTQDGAGKEKKMKLSDVVERPGWTATSLLPLQHRGWFIALQISPVLGFLAVWQWDRRRRFLELHPDIVMRRRARRALRRERRELRAAFVARDERRFAARAVGAMKIAVAPLHGAEPRAMVSRDIAEILAADTAGRELVQRFFAATDASEFSSERGELQGLLAMNSELDRVLHLLEARL